MPEETDQGQEKRRRVSTAVTYLADHEDDKVKVRRYDHHDGPSGYRVTLADGRLVFESSDWGGWHIDEFHPGKWCDYVVALANQVMLDQAERSKAEAAAKVAAKAAKFAPVDDAALFSGETAGGPNPERFYTWVVEVEVSETWVADGFDLTQQRLKDWIETDLSHSRPQETRCRIIHAPDAAGIAKAQGFESAEAMNAADKAEGKNQ